MFLASVGLSLGLFLFYFIFLHLILGWLVTTEIRFFALKSKKEKGTYWIEVRTVFNVKTTTTATTPTRPGCIIDHINSK